MLTTNLVSIIKTAKDTFNVHFHKPDSATLICRDAFYVLFMKTQRQFSEDLSDVHSPDKVYILQCSEETTLNRFVDFISKINSIHPALINKSAASIVFTDRNISPSSRLAKFIANKILLTTPSEAKLKDAFCPIIKEFGFKDDTQLFAGYVYTNGEYSDNSPKQLTETVHLTRAFESACADNHLLITEY